MRAYKFFRDAFNPSPEHLEGYLLDARHAVNLSMLVLRKMHEAGNADDFREFDKDYQRYLTDFNKALERYDFLKYRCEKRGKFPEEINAMEFRLKSYIKGRREAAEAKYFSTDADVLNLRSVKRFSDAVRRMKL